MGHQVLQRCHECSELGGDIWNLHFSPVACGLWAHSPEFGCQRSFAMNQPSAHPSGKMNSSLTSALPISALAPAWGCLLFPASCFSGKSYSQAFPQLLSGLWQGKARQGRRKRMIFLLSMAASPLNRAVSPGSIQPLPKPARLRGRAKPGLQR